MNGKPCVTGVALMGVPAEGVPIDNEVVPLSGAAVTPGVAIFIVPFSGAAVAARPAMVIVPLSGAAVAPGVAIF